ncbi:hypothetical protein DCC79_06785, partial [bacterium]
VIGATVAAVCAGGRTVDLVDGAAPDAGATLAALGGAGGDRGAVRLSGDIDIDIDAIRTALGR